ncbi:MAG: hypothetical protein ACM3PY_04375, partial [Omnitrophica WOR_2 bacterium]
MEDRTRHPHRAVIIGAGHVGSACANLVVATNPVDVLTYITWKISGLPASQVAVWSLANIAGIKLDDYGHLNEGTLDSATKAEIAAQTRGAAYEIIKRKGVTYYAIATG